MKNERYFLKPQLSRPFKLLIITNGEGLSEKTTNYIEFALRRGWDVTLKSVKELNHQGEFEIRDNHIHN